MIRPRDKMPSVASSSNFSEYSTKNCARCSHLISRHVMRGQLREPSSSLRTRPVYIDCICSDCRQEAVVCYRSADSDSPDPYCANIGAVMSDSDPWGTSCHIGSVFTAIPLFLSSHRQTEVYNDSSIFSCGKLCHGKTIIPVACQILDSTENIARAVAGNWSTHYRLIHW